MCWAKCTVRFLLSIERVGRGRFTDTFSFFLPGGVGEGVFRCFPFAGGCQEVFLWLRPLSLPLSACGQTTNLPACWQPWLRLGGDAQGGFLFTSSGFYLETQPTVFFKTYHNMYFKTHIESPYDLSLHFQMRRDELGWWVTVLDLCHRRKCWSHQTAQCGWLPLRLTLASSEWSTVCGRSQEATEYGRIYSSHFGRTLGFLQYNLSVTCIKFWNDHWPATSVPHLMSLRYF